MSLFKCGRDSTGIKCRTCIVGDSCRKEGRWFRKKADMEAHLQKAHGIHVILPRGLKIDEEEISTSMRSTATSFFSEYERQRSINRFLDPELKYNRSRRSHMRKLRTRAIKIFKATPDSLRTCKEADFIAQFVSQQMARYDEGKEHRMAKVRLKIADASKDYVSMVYDFVCILCEFKTYDYVWILCMNCSVRVMEFPYQRMRHMSRSMVVKTNCQNRQCNKQGGRKSKSAGKKWTHVIRSSLHHVTQMRMQTLGLSLLVQGQSRKHGITLQEISSPGMLLCWGHDINS